MIAVDDRDWFSWEGIARIRNACEKQAVDEGLDGVQLFFRSRELFDQCLAESPTYRERQEAWKAKHLKTCSNIFLTLSNEEIEYLTERLAGVNDPIGQSIVEKIKKHNRSDGNA